MRFTTIKLQDSIAIIASIGTCTNLMMLLCASIRGGGIFLLPKEKGETPGPISVSVSALALTHSNLQITSPRPNDTSS